MDKNEPKITPRQHKAIAAMLTEKDIRAAAASAEVGYTTLRRWLEDDFFINELRRAEGEIIASAVRSLISDLDKNILTMKEIRDDPESPVYVRLRAAQIIDQSLIKWREALDLELRLEALEKVVLNE